MLPTQLLSVRTNPVCVCIRDARPSPISARRTTGERPVCPQFSSNVWSEKKFVEKLRYIHRNPVKRGLVARPEECGGVAFDTTRWVRRAW